MTKKWMFGMTVLFLLAGLAAAPGSHLAAGAAPALAAGLGPVASTGDCFPVDECNVCCVQPNGQLICTQRLCS